MERQKSVLIFLCLTSGNGERIVNERTGQELWPKNSQKKKKKKKNTQQNHERLIPREAEAQC